MNHFKVLNLLFPALFLVSSCTTETTALNLKRQNLNPAEFNVSLASSDSFSYQNYQQVLSDYVDDNGMVNYKALKENRQDLDQFNLSLATLSPQSFENWTEPEKIAFWINAYNSLTLLAILENYPTKSIRDIPGVWTRLRFNVMGKEVTLDEIEHKILRVEFNEPRIHMGLVCASIGCPLLLQEPYTGEKLDQQLDEQTRKFLALNQNFKINQQENKVYLSSIFKWFGEDFIPSFKSQEKFTGNEKERAVLNFVRQYLDHSEQEYLISGKYQIQYLDYDWSLNNKSTPEL